MAAISEMRQQRRAPDPPLFVQRPVIRLAAGWQDDDLPASGCEYAYAGRFAAEPDPLGDDSCLSLARARLFALLDQGARSGIRDMLVSIPATQLAPLIAEPALRRCVSALTASGLRLAVLAGWPDTERTHVSLTEALSAWRRAGCAVGLDNFGYAPFPPLWPFVLALDIVRIDARLMTMLAASAIRAQPVSDLIGFVVRSGPAQVIADGCASPDHAQFARTCGATHAQGPHFGAFRFTAPHLAPSQEDRP